MTRTHPRRHPCRADGRSREAGAAAVEFALIVPLLLALIFGVIEFGALMAQKATVASSVRAGARFGAVNVYGGAVGSPHTCQEVIKRTREEAVTIALRGSELAVTVNLLKGSPTPTPTLVCSSAAGTTAITPSAGATALPCTSPTSVRPEVLEVRVEYTGSLKIPLAGVLANPDLSSKGTYSCEYR